MGLFGHSFASYATHASETVRVARPTDRLRTAQALWRI